jgi:hypothetical protein
MLYRLSGVELADSEQITQANFLSCEDILVNIEQVEFCGDILARVELKDVQSVVGHKSAIHIGRLLSRWISDTWSIFDIIGDVVNQTIDYAN